jgi:RecQ family ATP-dependent DNA helicase
VQGKCKIYSHLVCFSCLVIRFLFRSWAIERCLQGPNKSLLIMPTGYGKSLCYILPSLLLPGFTIVISPLLALMNDQIMKLPPELPAVCYNSQLSTQEISEYIYHLLQNKIKLIFISPEKFVSYGFQSLLMKLQKHLSLLCIDEAHCLSHWSYNFRPSFLRICQIIKNFKIQNILALTATASEKVQRDILKHLNITSEKEIEESCLRINETRNNLHLFAEYFPKDDELEEDKKSRLIQLIKKQDHQSSCSTTADSTTTEEFEDQNVMNYSSKSNNNHPTKSRKLKQQPLTIVYVWKRRDSEILSEYLKGHDIENVVYHGGLDYNHREQIQKNFDRGNVKCIIATIAFGMGIDKQDIRQVIHYNLPKSVENYIQEIGRAGRDGDKALCYLFFQQKECLLQSALSHSSHLSVLQIFTLLLKLFSFSKTISLEQKISINIKEIEKECDISSSLLETILSLLELSPYQLLTLQKSHYDRIEGKFRFLPEKYDKMKKDLAIYEQKKPLVQECKDELEERTQKSEAYQMLQLKLIQKVMEANEYLTKKNGDQEAYGDEEDSSGSEDDGINDSLYPNEENGGNDESSYSLFPDEERAKLPNQQLNTNSSSSSSPPFPTKFRISKTKLSNELNLSLDSICELLYQIQKNNGLIEYQLHDLHYYVSIKLEQHLWSQSSTAKQEENEASQFDNYLQYLYRLAQQLFSQLETIQQDNSYSIQKMFKIGSMIAKHQPIVPTDVNGKENKKFSSSCVPRTTPAIINQTNNDPTLQQFLLTVLNQEQPKVEKEQKIEEIRGQESNAPLPVPELSLWEEYHSIKFPFEELNSSLKLQLISEMKLFVNDILLQNSFKQFFKYSQKLVPVLSPENQISLDERKQMLTSFQKVFLREKSSFLLLYLMKLFYGFNTNRLTEMQGNAIYRDYWNKYRDYDYYEILSILKMSKQLQN